MISAGDLLIPGLCFKSNETGPMESAIRGVQSLSGDSNKNQD